MKTFPDPNLAMTTRVFQWKGGSHLAVSLLGAFSFDGGGAGDAFLPEAEVWALAGPVLGAGLTLEEGFPKPGREFFVSGSAYATAGAGSSGLKKAEAVNVSAKVGGLERSLRVTGDRHWLGTGLSKPEPFDTMPVDWAHAWGGPDVPNNPLGRGAAPDPKTGLVAYPNVVDPDVVPTSAGKPPPPASFLPVGTWPVRNGVKTTADQEFLASGERGFPGDFNWEWFFTAHPGQRGKGEFRPGEEFSVAGMHPDKTVVAGRIPRAAPWCRLERVGAGGVVEPVRIALAQDTLWLFPDREKGICVWHGTIRVADAEATGVTAVRAGFGEPAAEMEPPPAPKAVAPVAPPPAPAAPPPPVIPPLAAPAVPPAATVAAEGPATVEAEAVAAAAKPTREEIAAEMQKEFDDLFSAIASSPEMNQGGEELSMVNDILADMGREPLTEEAYRQGFQDSVAKMREDARLLADLMAEQAAEGQANDPAPALSGADDDELSDAELVDLLVGVLKNQGVDPDLAQSLAKTVVEPVNMEGVDTLAGALAAVMGVDPADLPFDPDAMLEGGEEARLAEDQAWLDEIGMKHFGKSFATLMDPDDDTIPVPASREEMEKFIGDPAVAEAFSEMLDQLFPFDTEEGEGEGEVAEQESSARPAAATRDGDESGAKKTIPETAAPPKSATAPGRQPEPPERKKDEPFARGEPPLSPSSLNEKAALSDLAKERRQHDEKPERAPEPLPPPDDIFGEALD